MVKNKVFNRIIKFSIIISSISYIAFKLWNEQQNGILFSEFKTFHFQSILLFAGALILIVFNWGFESIKWKRLLKPIQPTNLKQASAGVLAGVSVSLLTPNRVGEFGGRLFFVRKRNRGAAITASLIGNISQLLATLIFGLISLSPFTKHLGLNLNISINSNLLILITFVVILGGIFALTHMKKFETIFKKSKKWNNKLHFLTFLKAYKKSDLLHITFYSFLRYIVFAIQFFLLLRFFGIHLSYLLSFIAICQIYLIMTIIPTFALSELGVRGSVATMVLGAFSPYTAGIIAASLTLWIINLAIPALVGSYVLVRQKSV